LRDLLWTLAQAAGLSNIRVLTFTLLVCACRLLLIFGVNNIAQQSAGGEFDVADLLMVAAAAAILVYVAYRSRYEAHIVITRVQNGIRNRLVELLLKVRTNAVWSRDRGHVQAALTSDIADLVASIPHVVIAFEGLLIAIVVLPYILYLSPAAALAMAIALIIGTVGFVVFDRTARHRARAAAVSNAEFINQVNALLDGWREARLWSPRQTELAEQVDATLREHQANRLSAERRFAVSGAISQSAMILMLCFTLILMPVLDGGGTAIMLQVLAVVLLSQGPIEALFVALPRLSVAHAALERIRIVERELETAPVNPEALLDPCAGLRSIELQGAAVMLRDDADSRFRLGPLNLRFSRGEIVFITGGNGSGKSTLLSLLAGLSAPDDGQASAVLADGRSLPLDSVRDALSGVFSNFFLFDRAYGLNSRQQELLHFWLQRLDLQGRVSLRDTHFSTTALSAGQRRRLALAVALAEDKPVLLLDEFASEQDPGWRREFYEVDRKSTRLNSSHNPASRMPSSA
jgi:putative ATP-binding cassette transporter